MPGFFRSHNSHGLYQALGQLAASYRLTDRLPSERFRELASSRLSICLERHFFSTEGVHKEHSPGYQYMIISSLVGAARAGLLSPDQRALVGRAEEALAWMIMPSNELAPIGDTDHKPVASACISTDELQSDALKFVFTGGNAGSSPRSGVQAYPQAGYAFARLYDPDAGQSHESASYLAHMAAYHSRVHKHADHLSFVWSEGSCNILTDPGRFGYFGRTTRGDGLYEQGFWYSDPRRVYVESTRSHNCVEVDGKSFPRLTTGTFGSALSQADMQDGMAVVDSQVVLRPSLVYRRTLILAPKEFLVVIDWLFDRRGGAHDFRQWFAMPPGWEVTNAGGGYRACNGEMRVDVRELFAGAPRSEILLGNETPMQGWTSLEPGSLTPSPSFNFRQMNTANAKFVTVFSLTGLPTKDMSTRSNVSMSRAVLAWRSDGGSVRLELERSPRLTVRRALLKD